MKKSVVNLKRISVKNFKNIERGEYELKPKTEIYGKNKTGKTSLLDAIHFVYYGGKNDVEKIMAGKDETEVELGLTENDVPIKIHVALNRDKKVKVWADVNGVRASNPRTLIKRMLSFGTFNPREMVNKEGRKERLLKLIPIYIKEDDLTIPGEDGQHFPVADKGAIDFSAHAFNVLSAVYKDLYNTRQALNREKNTFKASHSERQKQYDQNIITFEKNYNTSVESVKESADTIIAKIGGLKQKGDSLKEELSKNKENIKTKEQQVGQAKEQVEVLKEQIEEYKKKLEETKSKLNIAEESLSALTMEKTKLREKEKDLEKQYNEVEPTILKNNILVTKTRNAERLRDELKSVEKVKGELDEKEKEWKIMDVLLKDKWPAFVSQVLEPISEKVKGLKIKHDGEMEYNGVPIDELSGSETIELGIELMRIENKSNLIIINEFEAMDRDSIKNIKWGDFNAIVARVAEDPIGGEWHSIKMQKKEGKK